MTFDEGSQNHDARTTTNKPTAGKAIKPAKKSVPPATDATLVTPLLPGYEPYDVVKICDQDTWADLETICTPEES